MSSSLCFVEWFVRIFSLYPQNSSSPAAEGREELIAKGRLKHTQYYCCHHNIIIDDCRSLLAYFSAVCVSIAADRLSTTVNENTYDHDHHLLDAVNRCCQSSQLLTYYGWWAIPIPSSITNDIKLTLLAGQRDSCLIDA